MKIVNDLDNGPGILEASLGTLDKPEIADLVDLAVKQILRGYEVLGDERATFVKHLSDSQIADISKIVFQNSVDVLSDIHKYRADAEYESETIKNSIDSTVKNLVLKISSHVVYNFFVEATCGISPVSDLPHLELGRKHIKELIDDEKEFCWVTVDLDYLGAYNEALGVELTDRLIKNVGEILKNNIRKDEADGNDDAVFHGRGDKFWLIINNTKLNNGLAFANRLVNHLVKDTVSLTVSETDIENMKVPYKLCQKNIAEGLASQQEIVIYEIIKSILEQIDSENTPIRRSKDQNDNVYILNVPVTASLVLVEFDPEKDFYIGKSSELVLDILYKSMDKLNVIDKGIRRGNAIAYDHINQLYYKLSKDGEIMHLPRM